MSPFNHGITKPSWEVPRNSESSMELGSILVTKFHGVHVESPNPVGKFHGIPWNYENSMERRMDEIPWNISFNSRNANAAKYNITEFYKIPWNYEVSKSNHHRVPWNFMQLFKDTRFHGIPWNYEIAEPNYLLKQTIFRCISWNTFHLP